MTPPKPDAGLTHVRAPLARDMPRTPQSGIDALLHMMPVAALHLSPPGQPDDDTIEAGFDNMPV